MKQSANRAAFKVVSIVRISTLASSVTIAKVITWMEELVPSVIHPKATQ